MPHQLINFRKERDFDQKINATFTFIRQNFRPLARCILFFVAPFALLSGIFTGIYQSRLLQNAGEETPYTTMGEYNFFNQITTLNYAISVFLSVFSVVLVSLTVYCYIVEYMDNEGEVTTAGVWERIKSHAIPVIYSSFGVMILCLLASLVLLVPGLYLGIAFSLLIIVMVREEIGFIEAIERCLYLIKGNWWSTFGFIIIVGAIQSIIAMLLSLPATAVMWLKLMHLPGAESQLLMLTANSFATITGVFLYSITMVGVSFQYFHIIEVKEGVGLLQQVDQIGNTTALQDTHDEVY